MILILFVLLLVVNVAFVEAQGLTQDVFLNATANADLISHSSVSDRQLPMTSPSIMQPQEESWRNRTYAAAPILAGDHSKQPSVQRSGTANFVVDMIASVMAVAVPVQRFINAYSSYDSGANQYSRPAIRIQPNISRGSASVSAQLRF